MEDNLENRCNHENKPGNSFCTQCGARLVKMEQADIARLIMLHGDRPDTIFYLLESDCSIGRDLENSVILNDNKISKQHAKISNSNGDYWIHDSKSKNGVYINGKKIKHRKRLHDGCLLKLGSTILRFDISLTVKKLI